MNPLIDAFHRLLTDAVESDGDLAKTAQFTLDNVDWTGPLSEPRPASNAVVDGQLEAACARTGPAGSIARRLAETLLAATGRLLWHTPTVDREGEPDIVAFAGSFSSNTVIGPRSLLPSDKVKLGFSLQGRDTYYPGHLHRAEESYWIIGGDGDWKVATRPWFAVAPGASIYHAPGVRHTMQTNEQPLLTVWLWTSHLDSEVVMVRG